MFPLVEDPASATRGLVLRCSRATVSVVSASATFLEVIPGENRTLGYVLLFLCHFVSMCVIGARNTEPLFSDRCSRLHERCLEVFLTIF